MLLDGFVHSGGFHCQMTGSQVAWGGANTHDKARFDELFPGLFGDWFWQCGLAISRASEHAFSSGGQRLVVSESMVEGELSF